jgi:hypothetical protein
MGNLVSLKGRGVYPRQQLALESSLYTAAFVFNQDKDITFVLPFQSPIVVDGRLFFRRRRRAVRIRRKMEL